MLHWMPDFKNQCCATNCAGVPLLLHPQRAAYWPAAKTLLVADVHLGKEQVFARAGSPIPAGPSEADIDRLAELVIQSRAARLLILGDLIHARPNRSENWLDKLATFLDQHQQLSVEVVAGNHDKPAGQLLIDNRIHWHTHSLHEGALVFQHEPGADARGHVICGHIHPCFRLSASRNDTVRAPVFWLGQQYSVLPSFGQFTGGHNVSPGKHDRLYMTGPNCVLPVFGQSIQSAELTL